MAAVKQAHINGFPALLPDKADVAVAPEVDEMAAARNQRDEHGLALLKPYVIPFIFSAGVIFNSYQSVAALREELNQTKAHLSVVQKDIIRLQTFQEIADWMKQNQEAQQEILREVRKEKRR